MAPVGCDRKLLDLNVDMEYLSPRKGGLYVQQEVRDVRNQTDSHSNACGSHGSGDRPIRTHGTKKAVPGPKGGRFPGTSG